MMNLKIQETFSIQLNMLSDWHIGSGSGSGVIDSIVQKDLNGLPYISAKTLTGILRDATELVALGLDNGEENGRWQEWVNCLFGEQPSVTIEVDETIESPPRPAALSIRSAHLPRKLSHVLSTESKSKLKNAICFIKPGIKIEQSSGCAEKDCLRFEEMVRQGTVLEALNCQLILPPESKQEQKQTAYALLIAGMKMVERLGGKRRRGAGLCQIRIQEESNTNTESWLQWLSKLEKPPSIPEFKELNENEKQFNHSKNQPLLSDRKSSLTEEENKSDSAYDWYSLDIQIITKSPVIINARTIGNVVETLDYIPAKYLLRFVHRKLGKWLNVNQAISKNYLVITNATLAINNQPSRPTPFCLFAEKINGGLDKGDVYNRFMENPEKKTENAQLENQSAEIQLKGIRGGYVGVFDGNDFLLPSYQKIEPQLYTHNTIEDQFQRPTRDIGGVFSYEAIPAKTTFKAQLRLPQSLIQELADNNPSWWNNLHDEYRIGQSKKDDYGLIELKTTGNPVKLSYNDFEDSSPNKNQSNNYLYVWLLSDVLLRDSRLRPTANPDDFKIQLQQKLGVELEERFDENLLSLMARQQRTDSWQVKWGLPRPSLVGLQAGSCFVYEVRSGKIEPNRIKQLEVEGIGERRAEGYGQICFNDRLLTSCLSKPQPYSAKQNNHQNSSITVDDNNFQATSDNIINPSDSSFDYARTVELEAWRDEIRLKSLAITSDENKRYQYLGLKIRDENGDESKPSMTQLGNLRTVIGRLQSSSDSQRVLAWIESVSKVPNRLEKWQDGSLDGSLDKIKNLIENKNEIWRILEISEDLIITKNGKEELQQKLWAEAIRIFIDACIRGHKRDLEKVESERTKNLLGKGGIN